MRRAIPAAITLVGCAVLVARDGARTPAPGEEGGDGYSDAEEKRAGTDPLDKLSFPITLPKRGGPGEW